MMVEVSIPVEPGETPVTVVDRPPNAAQIDAGEVHAWLVSQGFTLDGVQVQSDGIIIVINPSDGDAIAAALAGYTGYRTTEQTRADSLAAIVAQIGAKPEVKRTLAEQAILLMMPKV